MVKPYAKLYIPAWMAVYDRLRHSKGRPFKTTSLSKELGIPRTSVNQSLLALRVKGLVRKTSDGYVYNGFHAEPVSSEGRPCPSCGSKSSKTVPLTVAGSEKPLRLCLRCLSRIVGLSLRITGRLKALTEGEHLIGRPAGSITRKHKQRRYKASAAVKSAIYGRFVGRLISLVSRQGSACATSLGLRYGLSKREVRRVLERMAPKMGWVVERKSSHLSVRAGGLFKEAQQQAATPTIDVQG
ncbi:hypothetical protein HRbin01_01934 [archaeon HR01]|nr:hypothetical protein HRbin01_01934 [archaeon HR01]